MHSTQINKLLDLKKKCKFTLETAEMGPNANFQRPIYRKLQGIRGLNFAWFLYSYRCMHMMIFSQI